MRIRLFIVVLLWSSWVNAQLSVVTWNIQNLGKSKSTEEIEFIAQTLKSYDVLAIQEVVAGNGGAQAVARLADALNRKAQHGIIASAIPRKLQVEPLNAMPFYGNPAA